MKTIATNSHLITETYWHKDEFEIVDEFPNGYIVWNIGRGNFPFIGYLPLARPDSLPYHIKRSNLKTIKIDEKLAEHILLIASRGTHGEINKLTFNKIALEWKKHLQTMTEN